MSRNLTMFAVTLAVTGCATLARTVQVERSGSFAMPDVHGLTADQAKDELARAGITGSVELFENYTCDDPTVAETKVCITAPRAGAATSARIPVTLYLRVAEIQTFMMPDLMGKTAEQARQALLALGQESPRILVETIVGAPSDCAAGRVCRQSPDAGQKTWVNGPKYVGLGPVGAGPRAPDLPAEKPVPGDPEPARPPAPTPQPSPIF
jgi:beta-lactam-binding protein with PASTA domain